jgi:UDPglucose 6-dehydrogenase
MKVGIVGIGRVGLPFAAMSNRYHETIGIDIDDVAVRRVNERSRFSEPFLNEYLSEYNLEANTDFSKLADCEIVFVCVGSQAPGVGYSTDRIMTALGKVVPHLKSRNQVLVLTSTLPPQNLNELLSYLEHEHVPERIQGVCYNPAMIALGNVIRDFENPNFILIGETNSEAGNKVESYWRKIVPSHIPILHSSCINVAVAKYALNIALVLKISMMSILTELSEKSGADVDFLSEVLKVEPRVAGPKMFKGGLGYGGTCFPVDIEALHAMCKEFGVHSELPEAMESLNDWQVERSAQMIGFVASRMGLTRPKIAMLGITFKPDTSVVVASQPLMIAKKLVDSDKFDVIVCDPEGIEEAKKYLDSPSVKYTQDTNEAISSANIIFVGVEWEQFKSLNLSELSPSQVLIDPWRIFRDQKMNCGYIGYGLEIDPSLIEEQKQGEKEIAVSTV